MKKTDKKSDKKKTGKKKSAKSGEAFSFDSKQLQKEFNKRMKVLVAEVKKDTQKTIKVLMKEAKQKISAGSEFVRNDVLKSIVAQYENVVGADQGDQKPAPKTRTKSRDASASQPAAPPTVRKRATARQPSTAAAATKRARKTTTPVMATTNQGREQAA
jgi:hypothetical protein